MPKSSPFDKLYDSLMNRVADAITDMTDGMAEELIDTMEEFVGETINETHRRARGASAAIRTKPKRKAKQGKPKTHRTHPPVISFYDVLEVSPRASRETIEAAYKSMAKRFHPDRNPGDAGNRMRMVNAAWEVLGDVAKRREYDKQLRQSTAERKPSQ